MACTLPPAPLLPRPPRFRAIAAEEEEEAAKRRSKPQGSKGGGARRSRQEVGGPAGSVSMAAQGTNGGSDGAALPPQPPPPPPPPPPRPQYPPTHRGVLYRSTRGCRRDVTFEEVVMSGLAPDRGLYVPQEVPHIAPEQLEKVGFGRWGCGSVYICVRMYGVHARP